MSSIDKIITDFVAQLEKYPELKGHYKFDRKGAYNELQLKNDPTILAKYLEYTDIARSIPWNEYPIVNPAFQPVNESSRRKDDSRLYYRFWQDCRKDKYSSPDLDYSIRQGQDLVEAFKCDDSIREIVLYFNGDRLSLPVVDGLAKLPAPIWTTVCPYTRLAFRCLNSRGQYVWPNTIYKLGGDLHIPTTKIKPFDIGPFRYTGETIELIRPNGM